MKTLFINARNESGERFDMLVDGGKFVKIASNIAPKDYADAKVVDLDAKLVLSPFVDPHIHLDYVYTAFDPRAKNNSGTLFEGIARWSETKGKLTKQEIKDRAKIAVKKEILHGTQYIRTHVDVTDPKLTAFEAMMELKDEIKDILTLQIIAFPQEGMYAYKGGDELVEKAVSLGADVVGGIPHFEYSREMGEKSVHRLVDIAVKYNKLIDVHCDETDDPNSRYLELLANLSLDAGLLDKTTASHTCAMGSYDNAYAFKLMKLLKASKINIIACPTENLHLQGRYDNYPKRRGLTRIKELNDNGINVCFAQDSISDPWYPLGNGSLLAQLDFGIHAGHMMSIEEINKAFALITTNGAKTLHLGDSYGIKEGNAANFIVLDAGSAWEAIQERVATIASVRNGEYLFKTEPIIRSFSDKMSCL